MHHNVRMNMRLFLIYLAESYADSGEYEKASEIETLYGNISRYPDEKALATALCDITTKVEVEVKEI